MKSLVMSFAFILVFSILGVAVVALVANINREHAEVVRTLKLEHLQEVNQAFNNGRLVERFSMHAPIDDCDLHHVYLRKQETKAANAAAKLKKEKENEKS